MYVWRLSKHDDLSGRGGIVASGRWHTSPRPIVYCSDEPHTAYLEILRQIRLPSLIPDAVKLFKIDCPASAAMEIVSEGRLSQGWDTDPVGWRICRPIGDEWLMSERTALLKVPSAARKGAFNFLLNPAASAAQDIKIVETIPQPFRDFVTADTP